MYQGKFINFNKCTTVLRDIDNGEGYLHVGDGSTWKSLYLPLNLLLQKNEIH